MDSSAIRHIAAQHGNLAREAARGQVAIGPRDFERVNQIAQSAHSVAYRQRTKTPSRLEYNSHVGGFAYTMVAEVRPNSQTIAVKTMWKTKL